MKFYLPEPDHREDKPSYEALPSGLVDKIESKIGDKVINHHISWGGYSPTFSVIVTTQSEQSYFIKGTYPDHTAHGYQILKQEINVYENIAALSDIAPKYIGYVFDGAEDDWHLGIWQAIQGGHLKKALFGNDIDYIFKKFDGFYTDVNIDQACTHLPYSNQANFVQDILSGKNGWLKFLTTDGLNPDRLKLFSDMFIDVDAGKKWLMDHALNFNDLARSDHDINHKNSIISFDMRLDNIVFDDNDVPFIIDWPDASIGPVGYDQIYLAVNIMVESGQPAWEVFDRFQDHTGINVSRQDTLKILAQVSGYYALQAYRAVPEKLPRLRWIQKAMLWGFVKWLCFLEESDDLPDFKQ